MILKREINSIPTEILQHIFSYLNDEDVTSVSFVSYHWRRANERTLRMRCLSQIPENILIEITSEQNYETVDWTNIWLSWRNSQLSIKSSSENIEDNQPLSYNHQRIGLKDKITTFTNLRCIYVDDKRIYIGDKNGTIESKNILDKSYISFCTEDWSNIESCNNIVNLCDGGVRYITGLPYHSLLLAAGNKKLHFFDISFDRFQKLSTDFHISPGKTIKVFGPRFSIRDEDGLINIYEIFYVGQMVRIAKILEVRQREQILDWQLWNTKIICLLSTGEISVSSLLTYPVVEIYRSVCYSSILYKNPTWLFRDVVFVSTLASRGLLLSSDNRVHTYTYMSDMWNSRNGCGQWFVGGLDQLSDEALIEDEALATSNYEAENEAALIARRHLRGFCLHKHYIGSSAEQEISCVNMKLTILCCGTVTGSILIYQQKPGQSDPFQDMEANFELYTKEDVSNERIQNVDIAFTNGSVSIVYRTESCISSFELDSQLDKFKSYLSQPCYTY